MKSWKMWKCIIPGLMDLLMVGCYARKDNPWVKHLSCWAGLMFRCAHYGLGNASWKRSAWYGGAQEGRALSSKLVYAYYPFVEAFWRDSMVETVTCCQNDTEPSVQWTCYTRLFRTSGNLRRQYLTPNHLFDLWRIIWILTYGSLQFLRVGHFLSWARQHHQPSATHSRDSLYRMFYKYKVDQMIIFTPLETFSYKLPWWSNV